MEEKVPGLQFEVIDWFKSFFFSFDEGEIPIDPFQFHLNDDEVSLDQNHPLFVDFLQILHCSFILGHDLLLNSFIVSNQLFLLFISNLIYLVESLPRLDREANIALSLLQKKILQRSHWMVFVLIMQLLLTTSRAKVLLTCQAKAFMSVTMVFAKRKTVCPVDRLNLMPRHLFSFSTIFGESMLRG